MDQHDGQMHIYCTGNFINEIFHDVYVNYIELYYNIIYK